MNHILCLCSLYLLISGCYLHSGRCGACFIHYQLWHCLFFLGPGEAASVLTESRHRPAACKMAESPAGRTTLWLRKIKNVLTESPVSGGGEDAEGHEEEEEEEGKRQRIHVSCVWFSPGVKRPFLPRFVFLSPLRVAPRRLQEQRGAGRWMDVGGERRREDAGRFCCCCCCWRLERSHRQRTCT